MDIRNQRVGIIGTGSTVAQVVPGIVDKAGSLSLFQRTAQWVLPFPDKKYSEAFGRAAAQTQMAGTAAPLAGLRLASQAVFTGAVRGKKLQLWAVTREVEQQPGVDPRSRTQAR